METGSRALAVLWISLSTAACTPGTSYVRPTLEVPTVHRGTIEPPKVGVIPDWWDVYTDEMLRGLIRTALVQNTDVGIAFARVDAARAVAALNRLQTWPQITMNADAARVRVSQLGTTVLLPGFGASSKTSPEITIATQVGAISALMVAEQLDKVDVIGNSVGGWVAAQYAATYGSSIRRLLLVDAAGFKAMFETPPPANFYPGTVQEMQQLLAHTREFADGALKRLQESCDGQAAERVFQGLFVSPRLEDLMPKITTPTLVVWGAEDKLFPPVIADLLHGNIKGSSKVLIPKASHFPHIDNPKSFLAAVTDFLKG